MQGERNRTSIQSADFEQLFSLFIEMSKWSRVVTYVAKFSAFISLAIQGQQHLFIASVLESLGTMLGLTNKRLSKLTEKNGVFFH